MQGRSSIAISLSLDGLRWSSITDLHLSPDAGAGRTLDHPVDGWVRRGNEVLFYIQHQVPGVWHQRLRNGKCCSQPPAEWPKGLVAHHTPVAALEDFTARAKSELRSHVG